MSEKILSFIKNNKWIIIASIFFISWKFFLITIQFENGLGDKRFNDAFVYIKHIETIANCPSAIFCKEFMDSFDGYGGFEHLTYRLFFGTLSHILNASPLQIFYLSFYLGIILLVPTLVIFLKNINPDKKLIAFSLFFLALFNGAGSYHGFFWIVPSFFALLIFFIVFSIIIGNYKNWKIYLFLLIPALIYTHFLGLYMLSVLVFFFALKYIFTNEIDKLMLKKIFFLIIITTIFYVPTALYLKNSIYGGNPYGIESLVKNSGRNALSEKITSILNLEKKQDSTFIFKKMFPGFEQVSTDYIDWVFPHSLALIPFFITILILIYYNQYVMLSVFFSATIFTLLSSINIFAVRSLILLWPITYLFYAYGIWFSIKFIREKIKNSKNRIILLSLLIIIVILFAVINFIYSYLSAKGIPISFKSLIL